MDRLLVATLNILNLADRWPERLSLLLAWLEATRPDVVALQELKCTAEEFPGDDLARLGYCSLVVGQRTWNGVALLCLDHDPIEIRRALPGDARINPLADDPLRPRRHVAGQADEYHGPTTRVHPVAQRRPFP